MTHDYETEAPQGAPDPGLLAAVRRRPLWVIVPTVLAAALAVIVTTYLPTTYSTEAQVVLGDQNEATIYRSVPILNTAARTQNAVQVMRSEAVAARASELLEGRLSSTELRSHVSVTPGPDDSPLVVITATAGSAGLTRSIADAQGQAYLDVTEGEARATRRKGIEALNTLKDESQARLAGLNEQATARVDAITARGADIESPSERARFVQAGLAADQQYQSLKGRTGNLASSISDLAQKLQETRIDSSLAVGVDTLYPAARPTSPISPSLPRNVGLAVVLGLLLGAALAWRRQDRDRTVDPEQAAAALGAPLLASVARRRELRTPTDLVDLSPGLALADDLTGLATTLMLHVRRRSLDGLVLTSAHPGEGKTVLTLNLAGAAAAAGHRVTVVDADLRRATLTASWGLRGAPGLLDGGQGATTSYDYDGFALDVLPIGQDWQADAPAASAAAVSLPAATSGEHVTPTTLLVDSPAIAEAPTALQLSTGSTGLVVVVSRASALEDLRTLRSRAQLSGVSIVGFVLNDVRPARRRSGPVRAPSAAPEQASVLGRDGRLQQRPREA